MVPFRKLYVALSFYLPLFPFTFITFQFQSRLKPGNVRGHSVDSATPAPADAPIGLEGFEGFIPEGRKSSDVNDASRQPTSPVSQPSSAGSQKSLSSVDPNQLLGKLS